MPQTIKAKDGTELDAGAVNLAKAIRSVESGAKYDISGKSGEKGAYQWMPGNFEASAKQYGLNPADFSPVNQDKVAYHVIKSYKDRGMTPEQVAAAWNAGEKAALDGSWQQKVGTNQYGVQYDTPGYVKNVTGEFQKLKGSTGNQGGFVDPSAPSHINNFAQGGFAPDASGLTPDAGAGMGQEPDKSLLQKTAEFLFPILEKKERTGLQFAGDLGLSALMFVPGLGAASKGIKGLELLSKASPLAKGLATGYAADVTSKLGDGDTDLGSIVTPGLGTAAGGVLGTAGGLLSRGAPKVLSRTSGVPEAAFDVMGQRPGAVKGLLGATSPAAARQTAVEAVKSFRKSLSGDWEKGVKTIIDKYEPRRVGFPETVSKEMNDIASRYNTSTKTRINLPQNMQSFSAKELTDLLKDINGIKYNPVQPDIALGDMKVYLKKLGANTFNDGGEFNSLYSNYSTKKEILDAADDIVRAFSSKKPIQVTTAINRLQSIFNEGKEEYLKAIIALEKESGVDILSHIAANKFTPKLPGDFLSRGLDWKDLGQLLLLPLASPRSAGAINRGLQGTTGKVLQSGLQTLPILAPQAVE